MVKKFFLRRSDHLPELGSELVSGIGLLLRLAVFLPNGGSGWVLILFGSTHLLSDTCAYNFFKIGRVSS